MRISTVMLLALSCFSACGTSPLLNSADIQRAVAGVNDDHIRCWNLPVDPDHRSP